MGMVLVTGATGSVGSRVVRELRDRGVSVRAFVRDRDKAAALGPSVELAVGDLAEPASLDVALDGIDGLFLACGNSPRQVEFETNAIDVAAARGVRIVKLSAMGAEIGSPLEFWDWHGRIERRLHESRIPSVVLRPSFSMANILAQVGPVRQTGALFAPADDARIAMIDPGDVAAAAAAALVDERHDGQTYNLTGPEAITFDEVARQLSSAVDRPITFVDVPAAAACAAFVQAGMPLWLAESLATLFGLLRQGAHAAPTDGVRVLTGREPRAFSEFARDHAGLFAA